VPLSRLNSWTQTPNIHVFSAATAASIQPQLNLIPLPPLRAIMDETDLHNMRVLIQNFLTHSDPSGSKTALAAAALARAAVPLQTDWVRDFMLDTGIGADVRLLANPTAPRLLMKAGMHCHGGGMPECNDLDTFVLIPATTVGDETVGLLLASTGSDLDAVASVGRYHFNHATGALLALTRALPHEADTHVAMVSMLRQLAGGTAVDAAEPFAQRRKTHVLAWPAVRNRVGKDLPQGRAVAEKIFAVVDTELFEAGHYWQCIYNARHVGAAVRRVCADCLARELEVSLTLTSSSTSDDSCSTPTDGSPTTPPLQTQCLCRDALLPAESAFENAVCDRNLRSSHGGSWIGEATCVTTIAGLPGVARKTDVVPYALNRAFSISLQLFADATACAPLESLALTRAMALACVPEAISRPSPLALPAPPAAASHVFNPAAAAVDTGIVYDKPNVMDSYSAGLAAISPAEFAAALGDVTDDNNAAAALGDACLHANPAAAGAAEGERKRARSQQLAAARRERNRAAAARSNARRKERNDALRAALRSARRDALALAARERELRDDNVALRTRIATAQAAGGVGAVAKAG
jgi:hypothetical protein